MIEELQRLAMFVGDLNSSLDFAPKLPFDEVVPGDTWERTVSYQPQKMKSGKTVNQRLDYTFTFDGVKQWKGIDIHQITATLNLDTDAAPWLNELYGVSDRESDLAKMPLTMDAKIIFRLDMKTGLTLSAFAESKGGWEVFLKLDVQKSVAVQKIKGRTSLKLKKGTAE
jgi:hypothetical protein